MKFEDIDTLAVTLNAKLKYLSKDKLFICAHAYHANSVQPKDYILVEGIKNLRSTGRFTSVDRRAIDALITNQLEPLSPQISAPNNDPCMYVRIITF